MIHIESKQPMHCILRDLLKQHIQLPPHIMLHIPILTGEISWISDLSTPSTVLHQTGVSMLCFALNSLLEASEVGTVCIYFVHVEQK